MSFIKRVLSFHLLALILLYSSYGYSISANNSPARTASTETARYVIGDLVKIQPDKVVTSRGTYSTSYVPVLDMRTPATLLVAKDKGAPQGKVQLKFDSRKQLLEVILY